MSAKSVDSISCGLIWQTEKGSQKRPGSGLAAKVGGPAVRTETAWLV
jgi:hypothetical protein